MRSRFRPHPSAMAGTIGGRTVQTTHTQSHCHMPAMRQRSALEKQYALGLLHSHIPLPLPNAPRLPLPHEPRWSTRPYNGVSDDDPGIT